MTAGPQSTVGIFYIRPALPAQNHLHALCLMRFTKFGMIRALVALALESPSNPSKPSFFSSLALFSEAPHDEHQKTGCHSGCSDHFPGFIDASTGCLHCHRRQRLRRPLRSPLVTSKVDFRSMATCSPRGSGNSASITLPDAGHSLNGSWIDLGQASGQRVDILFALPANPTFSTSGIKDGAASDGVSAVLSGSTGGYIDPSLSISTPPCRPWRKTGKRESGSPPQRFVHIPDAIPEPTSLSLLGLALAGVAAARRKTAASSPSPPPAVSGAAPSLALPKRLIAAHKVFCNSGMSLRYWQRYVCDVG